MQMPLAIKLTLLLSEGVRCWLGLTSKVAVVMENLGNAVSGRPLSAGPPAMTCSQVLQVAPNGGGSLSLPSK